MLAKVITVRPLSEDGPYTGSQRTLQILKSNGRLVRAIRNDGKSQADPWKRRWLWMSGFAIFWPMKDGW